MGITEFYWVWVETGAVMSIRRDGDAGMVLVEMKCGLAKDTLLSELWHAGRTDGGAVVRRGILTGIFLQNWPIHAL